jgi:hypothetical protein
MEQFNVSKLIHFQVLILKGLQFKVFNFNFNSNKNLAQKLKNVQKFHKIEKYFYLCRYGKGTTIIGTFLLR